MSDSEMNSFISSLKLTPLDEAFKIHQNTKNIHFI